MTDTIPCILAIAPVSRGLGLFVLGTDGTPIDWRAKDLRVKPELKNARRQFEVEKLLAAHRPLVLVIEDHRAQGSKKQQPTCDLLDLLEEEAHEKGIAVAKYGPRDVREALGLAPIVNKDVVAAKVAKRLAALERLLPKPRNKWESEQHNMPMFTAAALALAHVARSAEEGSTTA